jgi:hypothetical protein
VLSDIWRTLLRDARDLVDELVNRGTIPEPDHVVECVLLAHRRRLGDGVRFRDQLRSDVEYYLREQIG